MRNDGVISKTGHSFTGGVTPMSLLGRLERERERVLNMTDLEREFRAKYLKSQYLNDREPLESPEHYLDTTNIFRRIGRMPLDYIVYRPIKSWKGEKYASAIRYGVSRVIMTIVVIYAGAYYFKYHQQDWTSKNGWRVQYGKKPCYPGEPGYPNISDRTKPSDYCDMGFSKRNVFLD